MKLNKSEVIGVLSVLLFVTMLCFWCNRHQYIKAPTRMPTSQAERFHWILSNVESTLDLRARKGGSYGIVQVTHFVTDELKDVYGTNFSPSMCMGNKELSWRMMDMYLGRPEMYKVFGPNPLWTDKAGVWKEGVVGYSRGKGRAYIEKCKRIEAKMGWGGPNSLFK